MFPNPRNKFWLGFFRNAEGADGGGAAGDSSGVVDGTGAPGAEAGADAGAPPATFLTQAGQPPGNTPPAEEAAAGAEGDDTDPEAHAPFDLAGLALPEGFELDEELGKGFAELLTDENLTAQERGQKLVDLHATTVQSAVERVTAEMQQANMDLWKQTNETWRSEIAKLPEFKDNPDAEAGKVMQALTAVGAGKEFFQAIDMTGAGNHPAILQILHRLTKPFMEGGAVGGAGAPKGQRQLGSNIYTSTNKPGV